MNTSFVAGIRREWPHAVIAGIVIVLVWIVVSQAVFAFRNPHLTDTERFLRFAQALRFEKVQP